MRAIVYKGKQQVALEEKPIPEVPEGWALIKVSHAGICGSDITIFSGAHPRAKAPLIMGHEFSGYLEDDIEGVKKGSLVTVNPLLSCGKCIPCREGNSHVCKTLQLIGIDCNGGMAEYAAVPVDMIVPVPGGMSPKVAAFVEPVAVTVHAVRMAEYRPGDNALVFGAGTIGLSTALTLRRFGASDITVCEPNPIRLEMAEKLGFRTILSDDRLLEKLNEQSGGEGFDYVFDCAGHQSVADILPDVVKIRGKIEVIAGYKYPPTMNFQKGMFKEFAIQFTRVYTQKDFKIATALAQDVHEYAQLINYELKPEDAGKGFELLTTPTDAIKVMYTFD